MRQLWIVTVAVCIVLYAQPPPPVIPEELQYLRFVILNIASLDHSTDAVKSFEDMLVKQLGLNAQESAIIRAAGQSLKPVLAQHRQTARGIVTGKASLTAADRAALAALDTEREQMILDRANQILNTVRGATAGRMKSAGRIASTKGKK
jgi:hypothetical protein